MSCPVRSLNNLLFVVRPFEAKTRFERSDRRGCFLDASPSMSTCAHCDARVLGSKQLQCASCKSAVYCSKNCQVAAWKTHKKTCRQIAGTAAQCRQALLETGAAAGAIVRRHRLDAEVHEELDRLYAAEDYDGVVGMRDETVAVAERMRERPGLVAVMYGITGTAMRVKGLFGDAYSMFSKAKEVIDSFSARDDPVKSQFCTNMAYALQDLYRDAESLEMHEYAVRITRHEAPGRRLAALGGLASCFAMLDDYAQSKKCYETLVEAADHTDRGVSSAKAFQQYAAMEMAFGEPRRAYALFLKCREHVQQCASPAPASAAPTKALCIMGMTSCMWDITRSTDCVRERAATLQSFEAHFEESKTTVRVDFALRLQMNMFSAFERHIHGDSEKAHRNVLQVLALLMKDAREHCACCGRVRSETRLFSCGKCLVARFCDVRCQRKANSKKNMRKKNQALLHSDVCDLLEAYTIVMEQEPEVTAAGAAALAAGGDELQAKLDKVAENRELAYRLEDLIKEFLDVKTAFASL